MNIHLLTSTRSIFSVIIGIIITSNLSVYGQVIDFNSLPTANYLSLNMAAGSSNLANEISSFNQFPDLSKYYGEHIYFIQDSTFGKVPFKIFLPKTYNPAKPSPVVLLLHGAVGHSKFDDAFQKDALTKPDDELFYGLLCKANFIVVKPYGDQGIGFDWAASKFGLESNPTFAVLAKIIFAIKGVINVDDNRLFAMGHSDGSDGAIGLSVYKPTQFAGFLAYNSMFTNLFSKDFYIINTKNRPIYAVHSSKDDLRPIEQTRAVVKKLDSVNTKIYYREYIGYQHFDKHLTIDFPSGLHFIDSVVRNPYPESVYWETSNLTYNKCDWLIVDSMNTQLQSASWYKEFNGFMFDKRSKTWNTNYHWYNSRPACAIKAQYANNVFSIETSRVTKFELLVSPFMVDLDKDVEVIVNGRSFFRGKVKSDKSFMLQCFKNSHDRKSIWVNHIVVDSQNMAHN